MLPLIQEVELLFGSQVDAKRSFGCIGSMQETAQGMLELSKAHRMVLTLGQQGALLWDTKEWQHEPARLARIVERLGAGGALAADVIHGWLDSDLADGLRYGVTLAALALSQSGDMVITNRAELLRLSQESSPLIRSSQFLNHGNRESRRYLTSPCLGG